MWLAILFRLNYSFRVSQSRACGPLKYVYLKSYVDTCSALDVLSGIALGAIKKNVDEATLDLIHEISAIAAGRKFDRHSNVIILRRLSTHTESIMKISMDTN